MTIKIFRFAPAIIGALVIGTAAYGAPAPSTSAPDKSTTTTASAASTPSTPKYPMTAVCGHCQIKMTIKSEADLKKDCPVCACGMKVKDCIKAK